MGHQTLTGGCLCGQVRYTAVGETLRFYHCHCSRCRRATGTGHASNLFLTGTLTWDRGAECIKRFTPPDAGRFTNTFCTHCGARLPRSGAGSSMVMIPAGSLDGEPDLQPQARIHQASRAGWSCTDELPVFEANPS